MLIFRTRFDFGGASDAHWRLLNTRPFAMIRIHSTEDGKLFAKSHGLLYHFPYRLMRLGNFPRYPRPELAHINQLIALQAKDVELTLFSNIRYDCILRWIHDLKVIQILKGCYNWGKVQSGHDHFSRREEIQQSTLSIRNSFAYLFYVRLYQIKDFHGTYLILFCSTNQISKAFWRNTKFRCCISIL